VTADTSRRLLDQALAELAAARRHLDFSAERVRKVPANLESVSEEALESAEAFTSRFARTVDLLVNKVLRAIDRIELKPQGTLLDVVNGAEQRGFVASAGILREMKLVRNEISHDYAGSRLPEVFAYCRDRKPLLDALCDRVLEYANRLPK
jgi:hypothetical protein